MKSKEVEKWKTIKLPWGQCIELSSFGAIKSAMVWATETSGKNGMKSFRYGGHKDGSYVVNHDGRGRPIVLFQFGGVKHCCLVHRLVAEHFVKGRTEKKNCVFVKNGIKWDIRPSNLEWVAENDKRIGRGEKTRVRIILEDKNGKTLQFPSMVACAAHFGITKQAVSRAIVHKTRMRNGYTATIKDGYCSRRRVEVGPNKFKFVITPVVEQKSIDPFEGLYE